MSPRKYARMLVIGSAVAGFLGMSAIPAWAATLTVDSTADVAATDGACTLREAIQAANTDLPVDTCGDGDGTDTIAFNLGAGTPTITPTTALPTISAPVILDGNTGGATRVVLDGQSLNAHGLQITGGGSTVRALVINDFDQDGIRLETADGNTIVNSYIGTESNGTTAAGNGGGITAATNSHNNVIGGTTVADRNVISGNLGSGVELLSTGNQVRGNYIGLGSDGTTDVGNVFHGVSIFSANTNTVGGTTTGARNVISGNGSAGVLVAGTATGNLVQGNYLGVDALGTTAKPNLDGVFIGGNAVGNTVGGSTTTAGSCDGACNLIAGNSQGVYIASGTALSPNAVRGNFIGVEASGSFVAEPNTFAGVVIDGGTGTIIGGTTATQRNVISGNGNAGGIFVQPVAAVTGLQILGNYIGLAPNGSDVRANGSNGITLNGVNNVTITQTTIQGNVISSNTGRGIFATDEYVESITVRGNTIGLAANGSDDRGNGTEGVYVHFDVTGPVTVGGTSASERNVVSGNGAYGLWLRGTATYTVRGNRVGTDAAGEVAVPNVTIGLQVEGFNSVVGGDNTTPGGPCSGACNLVSGNAGAGIGVTSNTQVLGNYVGTNLAGTAEIPNTFYGICECSTDNGVAVIGGTTAAQRNVVSGNDASGIAFPDPGAINNIVHGNYIGIGADGTPLGNGEAGVLVTAPANEIGGSGAESNEIAHNGGPGVRISGTNADGNSILGNSIHDNGGLGIDLEPSGVTPNDTDDPDVGPNQNQNFPVVMGAVASGSQTQVTGTLNSIPSETFDVEVFSSPECDASGNGEGETYGITSPVTTNASGDGTFTATIPAALPGGSAVTATATDDDGNTSEFSACITSTVAPTVPTTMPPCLGAVATIAGTSGNDTLTGTSGADVIAGLGGNDAIAGLGGKDLLCAGEGNDKVSGGGGKDRALGEAGKDNLKGGGGNDRLSGGSGRDFCSGGAGTDRGPGCERKRKIP